MINLSINPWYFCNFSCNFCYLTPKQLSDKKLLDLGILSDKLAEVASHTAINQIDLYGGELGLLPLQYFQDLKNLCLQYTDDINLITNLSMVNEITTDPDVYISVSYDFGAREQSAKVWRNMALLERPFSVLMLASPAVVHLNVDEMINSFNLLPNIASVEIKPYSANQSNNYQIKYTEFEQFVRRWLESPIRKHFEFTNNSLLRTVVDKTRNSFSDDHVYITPNGSFGVLEFDLNDREYFLEYNTFDQYLEWCNKEKARVSANAFCSKCEHFGHCLSEHLKPVHDLTNSCNGFKMLINWYKDIYERPK